MAKAVRNACVQENGKLPTIIWQDLQKCLNWQHEDEI